MCIYLIIAYFLSLFINFLYYNTKEYRPIDNDRILDIIGIIFTGPVFLLFNITRYGFPFLKKKHKYIEGEFQFGDIVEVGWEGIEGIEGMEGIYWYNNGKHYVILKDGTDYSTYNSNDIRPLYRGELKEELQILDEAKRLKAKADKLLSKIDLKRNVFKTK